MIGDGDEIERLERAVAEVVDDGRARVAQSVILALLVDRVAVHGQLCELLHDVQLAHLGNAADAVAVQIERGEVREGEENLVDRRQTIVRQI